MRRTLLATTVLLLTCSFATPPAAQDAANDIPPPLILHNPPPGPAKERAAYAKYLQSRLEAQLRGFRTRRPWIGRKALVKMWIGPSGYLISRSIVTSSGIKELDAAMLAAVDRSSPFTAPPPIVLGVDINVEITALPIR